MASVTISRKDVEGFGALATAVITDVEELSGLNHQRPRLLYQVAQLFGYHQQPLDSYRKTMVMFTLPKMLHVILTAHLSPCFDRC